MQRFGVREKPLLVTILAISLIAPLAIWRLSPWRPSDWLASRLVIEMERADDDQVDLHAQQLSSVGEAGWKALVRGLQSQRPAVRDAALQATTELIDSWQRLPADLSTPRVAALARLLVGNLPTADSDSLHHYADLAERLLDWPGGGGDGLNRIYDCEQVLRAARRDGWPRTMKAEPAPEPPLLAAHLADPPTTVPPAPAAPFAPQEDSPDAMAVRELGPALSTPEIRVVNVPEVKSLGLQPEFKGASSVRDLGQLTSANSPPPEAIPAEPLPIPALEWPALEIFQVLQHLRDSQFAAQAESELRRRGFDELNLRVARATADDDPESRIKLVRQLPELTGVDATSWLLLLARDESPRVRTAAVQVLSTATDPRIHRQLQKLAETEGDAGVHAALRNSGKTAR